MTQMDFDTILSDIGKLGWYQLYLSVLVGLGMLMVAVHCLANIFLSGTPDYWCVDEHHYGNIGNTSTWVFYRSNNITVDNGVQPMEHNATASTSSCSIDPSVRHHGNLTDMETPGCSSWSYDNTVYGFTAVTKWDLVCRSEWKVAFGQSMFMTGYFVGAVTLGNIADLIGRRTTWLASMTTLCITAVSAAFLPNYWGFIVIRAISGFVAAGVANSGFVLSMEVTGSSGRMLGGIAYCIWFAFGHMALAGLAYGIKDFRYLQLTIGLISLLFIPYFWILDESARWLMAKQKYGASQCIIDKIAKMNKRKSPQDSGNVLLEERSDRQKVGRTEQNGVTDKKTESYSLATLMKYPRLRWRAIIVCFNWFTNSFVYYGLAYGSANLLGGPYLNLFLSGLIEFPSYLVCGLTLNRLGRRNITSVFLLIAGICCIALTFLDKGHELAKVILSLLGKMAIAGSFCVIYIYSSELFPTVVRNLVVGTGSTCARMGAIIAPFILLLGHYWSLSYAIVSILAGLWTLMLPETMKQHLPDTIEEGERFGMNKSNKKCSFCVQTHSEECPKQSTQEKAITNILA